MSRIIKKQDVKPKKEILAVNRVVYFFTVILLAVFPLYYHNYYFDILPAKYKFYYCAVIAMAICLIAALLIFNRKDVSVRGIRLTVPDVCMLLLIIIIAISTLQSDYKYESLWGNEARYNGLFLWFMYGLSYVMITGFLKVKNSLMDWFLAAGLLVCLFGITDYFGMDLLHFKVNVRASQKNIFTSTFGNINVYTAYVGMVSAVAVTLYATARTKGRTICYFVVMVISFLAMIMGRSDNGYLAMGVIFAVLPFYLFTTRTGIKRYFVSIASLLTAVWAIHIADQIWPDRVMGLDSLFGMMSRSKLLIYGVGVLWILIAVFYAADYYRRDKKKDLDQEKLGKMPRYLWGAFLGLCLAVVLGVLYDANIAGNGSRYEKFAEYLIFNDQWGTDRGFVWKLCISHFKDFSFMRKLFGFGPDTFGILTSTYDMNLMMDYNGVFFDSAHNEYLHYLITIGLLGTAAYVTLLGTSAWRIMRKAGDNPYAAAAVFAVLAYAAQAAVNIAQPIITPFMFTLLMIGLAACNQKEKDLIK